MHGFWTGLYQHSSLYRGIVKVTWRVFSQLKLWFLFLYAIIRNKKNILIKLNALSILKATVWTSKCYNSEFCQKQQINSACAITNIVHHNNKVICTFKTFELTGKRQVFAYILLSFKILKLFRKLVALLCDILMLYLQSS